MKLKTYLCPSMDKAMQTIRQELGPDAVIISSLNEGNQVRVTAACEKLPEQTHIPEKPSRVFSELETKNTLCHILSYHKVPSVCSDRIIQRTCQLDPKVFTQGLSGVVDSLFSIAPLSYNANESHPNQIMLAGQVGVGKTVTLAKMASEYVLAKKPVEVISADYLKAGATEQIQIYTEALKIPLTLVETPQQLEKKLATSTPGTTYLIDTPGTNILNQTEIATLTNFIIAAKQAPILVLPAGMDAYEQRDTAGAFKDLGCTKFIMTRFDTSKRLGSLLSVLESERLQLTALSNGPEIGSRLKSATASLVSDMLMRHLPDILTTHTRVQDLMSQPKNTQTTSSSHMNPTRDITKQPQSKQPVPAWVKGIMEAKQA